MSCLFWEPLRPCGGAAGAQSAHKAGAFGPGFGLAGRGPKAPGRQTPPPPPGRPGYPSPRVQRRGMGGAVQPIPTPSPWACRVPLRLAAAAAAPRFRQGCGNRCGPAGGRRGRKAPTKPGPLAPALVWQAGAFGPRPPNAAAPPAGRPTANKSLGKRKRPRNRGLCCFY